MDFNQALERDNAIGSEVIITLDAIADLLNSFKNRYPKVFQHLCEKAREGTDFTLADADSVLGWTLEYLVDGSEKF